MTQPVMDALARARAAYSTGGVEGASSAIKWLFDVYDGTSVGEPPEPTMEMAQAFEDAVFYKPWSKEATLDGLRAALRTAPWWSA